MTNIPTPEQITETLLARIDAGTICYGSWTDRAADGRGMACALTAIWPPCGEQKSASACPAEIMPQWLAHLVPWMHDAGSKPRRVEHLQRLAHTAPAWQRLTERHEYAVRALICREAARHGAAEICGRVAALCDRVAAGESRANLDAEFAAAAAEAAEAAAWARTASADRVIDGILAVLEAA